MTDVDLDARSRAVLRVLYELAALDIPADAGVVARALALVQPPSPELSVLQLGARDVARVLLVLDARGLVIAERARLSLRGLAEAARCPALDLERLPTRELTARDLARREAGLAARAEGTRSLGPSVHARKPGRPEPTRKTGTGGHG